MVVLDQRNKISRLLLTHTRAAVNQRHGRRHIVPIDEIIEHFQRIRTAAQSLKTGIIPGGIRDEGCYNPEYV